MREVTLFSGLLVLGLFGSQWLPLAFGEAYPTVSRALLLLTMITLAFIMIHVGYEFELEKSNLRQHGWDYLVAFTAASLKMNTAKALIQSSSRGIPFDILRAYGIGDEIIDIWKKSYGEFLLPIQEKAIVKHNVLGGRNLIIFAPTSSGKTLVGEIVSVHYAMAKKRALYLVPMKALAEERYHHFREMYGELGVKTIISTHDRKEYDQDLKRKESFISPSWSLRNSTLFWSKTRICLTESDWLWPMSFR